MSIPASGAVHDAAADLATRTPWSLARIAGVSDPDTLESAGAAFLFAVRDEVLQTLDDADGDAHGLDDETAHLIADGAVPIYTHERMLTLVDLAAYHEDLADLASGSGEVDLVSLAGLALYQVGRRLAESLIEDLHAAADEDDSTPDDGTPPAARMSVWDLATDAEADR